MDQWKSLSSGGLSWQLRASKHQKRYHRRSYQRLLVRFELPIQNLRRWTYNGVSNMMGKKSGIPQQILKEQPRALITHCHVHSFSLFIKDTNKQCCILSETMGTAGEIIVLIKFSPNANECLNPSMKTWRYWVMVIMTFLRKWQHYRSYQLLLRQFVLMPSER